MIKGETTQQGFVYIPCVIEFLAERRVEARCNV
jgi:hypothetical protein